MKTTLMFKTTSVALLSAAAIAPAAGHAATTATPRFVGIPSATFATITTHDGDRYHSLAVVARFDRALPRSVGRVVIGPHLATGQRLTPVEGGDKAHRVGDTARHCYAVEAGRPRPVTAPTFGARWRVAIVQNGIITRTAATTLRRGADGDDFVAVEARRLGCMSITDNLVGLRRHVQTEELMLYDNPAEPPTGLLRAGQSFKVIKLSPSKRYAYGYAYGHSNRYAWVRTGRLIATA